MPMTPPDDSSAAVLLPALVQVLHRFFHELDERRYDAVASIFTEDCRWLRQGRWLEGRAAVLAALEARPTDSETLHVMSNAFVVEADDTTALLEGCMTAYRYPAVSAGDDLPTVSMPLRLNRVTTIFRHDPAQGWRIAEQRLVPLFGFA